jgi:hypothetical protein
MCGAMDIGHDQSIWHAIQSDSTLHSSFDTSSARCPDFTLSHKLDSFEQMNFGFVTGIAMCIQCNFLHALSILGVWHDVERVIQEGSVDHVSRSPKLSS